MNKNNGAYIVSWVFSNDEETDILLVGNQVSGKMTVVNAFQGKEARDIYEKLTGNKKEVSTNE